MTDRTGTVGKLLLLFVEKRVGRKRSYVYSYMLNAERGVGWLDVKFVGVVRIWMSSEARINVRR